MKFKELPLYLRIMIITFFLVLGAGLLYIVFKYAIPWLLPFILAIILVFIMEPPVKFLTKKCRIPRKISSFIVLILFISLAVVLSIWLVNSLVSEIMLLVDKLPSFAAEVPKYIESLEFILANYISSLPKDIINFVDTAMDSLSAELIRILVALPRTVLSISTSVAAAMPSGILFFVAFLVSAYFISSDLEKITGFIKYQFSTRTNNFLGKTKVHLISTLFKFLKAQLILLFITFCELYIGFLIMGMNYALLLAVVISIIDILPILGTGTVLIPWALVSLILGNYKLAFSLLLLYIIILFVRQALEPRIVGASIGLYPLITLVSMYAGLQMMGVFGMFVFPLVMIIIIYLQVNDYVHFWKDPPRDREKKPSRFKKSWNRVFRPISKRPTDIEIDRKKD